MKKIILYALCMATFFISFLVVVSMSYFYEQYKTKYQDVLFECIGDAFEIPDGGYQCVDNHNLRISFHNGNQFVEYSGDTMIAWYFRVENGVMYASTWQDMRDEHGYNFRCNGYLLFLKGKKYIKRY